MAIRSHRADGRGDCFIDARSILGSSCEGNTDVSLSVIRESHCGPLDLCTHSSAHLDVLQLEQHSVHILPAHMTLMPSRTDKAGEPFLLVHTTNSE